MRRALRHVRKAELTSTMDVCRDMVNGEGYQEGEFLLLSAERQSSGRGTSGRQWQSPAGNALFTLAVPKDAIKPAVLPVYPLIVARAVLSAVTQLVGPAANARVECKWPNDVLVNGEKVAGCLIEDAGPSLLVGVGINVAVAPDTGDGGRRSACIAAHNADAMDAAAACELCAKELMEATASAEDRALVVAQFRQVMAWDCVMYTRGADGSRADKVRPKRLGQWGELTVVVDGTGEERTLLADYLI